MYEWNDAIQRMLDWIEENLTASPTLLEMSREIGYSPFYCSSQFHEITGMTLKSYLAVRRLSKATLVVRDSKERILDIALQYGYSSQEAFSRAFKSAYGCTPSAYRKNPRPVELFPKKNVFFPEHYTEKGEPTVNQTILTQPQIRIEHIPAHKYIGIWDNDADSYCSFWEHHNCEEVCGIIDSMSHVMHPVVTCHTAGWFHQKGKKGYFYGLGVTPDYEGELPKGFTLREIPESYYLVFFHPAFDFIKDCGEVMERVEKLAWGFDPAARGYAWNEELCPDYQRHYPEVIGYEVLRPIKKLSFI